MSNDSINDILNSQAGFGTKSIEYYEKTQTITDPDAITSLNKLIDSKISEIPQSTGVEDPEVPELIRNGQGLVVGLKDRVSGNTIEYDGVLKTPTGRKFTLVGGVIRNMNDGQGWKLIVDATHDQCNIDSVTNDTSLISVNFSTLSVKKIITFLANPDDTLAKSSFDIGSSVVTSSAQISMKRRKAISDYISYNGATWASSAGVYTFSFNAGTLTLTHENVETAAAGLICNVTGRDGVYVPQAGSANATTTQIKFYDWAGTLQTTENANMKAYVNRGFASVAENPNNVNNTTYPSSNIWFIGILELN